jgi:imidazole glycerol-phosphate synthase subunit HisF
MLTRRVIACLDVEGGRVVKGVQFQSLRDVGDPVELAEGYEREGADEIVFLDIAASAEGRETMLDVVRRTAERLFIPLTLGGGIRTADDVERALRAGADKVSINSASVDRPELLSECADRFGCQCVVASIDAKREGNEWRVFTHGGRRRTELEAVRWAVECACRGAGEILLTSMDKDGARTGYDLELTAKVAQSVAIPVIASGGAGQVEHLSQALREGQADAVLLAGVLHDKQMTVSQIKSHLQSRGISVRGSEAP